MPANENDSSSPEPGSTVRGEITTGAGTVVRVRGLLRDGRLFQVQFHGDLAIRPDTRCDRVLTEICKALDGIPHDLEDSAIAARIRAAIPYGADLLGATPRELASGVRATLGNASPTSRIGSFSEDQIDRLTERWKHYRWRVIPESALPAATNVALDDILSEGGSPCLRFWQWSEPAVVLGRCQSIENEVDVIVLAEKGMVLVRRSSGGGAMFVQPHGTITYSMILPEDAVAGLTIRQSYEVCDAWVVRGLRELGVDAHHVPVNDIACERGKIGGAAQSRRRGLVLHHTAIAYDLKMDEMTGVLRIGRVRGESNTVASAAKVVSPLTEQVRRPRESIVAHLLARFCSSYGGAVSALRPEELAAAADRVRTKYGHPDWTNAFS